MLLVLAVPGLLDLRDAGFAFDAAPSLARLLVAASITAREPGDLAAPLAALYGIARQSDWPLAPIRLAALGVDPGDAYWLAADPVTLVVGRDDVLADRCRRRSRRGRCERADRDAQRPLRRRWTSRSSRHGPTRCSFARRRAQRLATHATGRRIRTLAARAAARRAPTRGAGGAGRARSRCCCTSIRSTSRGNARPPAGEQPLVLLRRHVAGATRAPCRRCARSRRPASPSALAAHASFAGWPAAGATRCGARATPQARQRSSSRSSRCRDAADARSARGLRPHGDALDRGRLAPEFRFSPTVQATR